MRDFDDYIKKRFGDSAHAPSQDPPENPEPVMEYYQDDEEGPILMPEADDIGDLDTYINAEVLLPQDGSHMRAAQVVGRSRNADGEMTGTYHPNPILNSQVYDVMFPDSAIQ